ncbi:hypothetical protein C6W91_21095 [Phaeobacter sp. SYSU ZJ3003]
MICLKFQERTGLILTVRQSRVLRVVILLQFGQICLVLMVMLQEFLRDFLTLAGTQKEVYFK